MTKVSVDNTITATDFTATDFTVLDSLAPYPSVVPFSSRLLESGADSSTGRLIDHSSIDSSTNSSTDSSEALVSYWLENLLRHFGVRELQATSDQSLLALLTRYLQNSDESNRDKSTRETDTTVLQAALLNDSDFLAHLKRRIIALAGAQLDAAFCAIAPHIIDEADAEAISLTIDSRLLQALRYQGEVYRLVEAFAPAHRLQAFCLGHTLNEQMTSHVITQSPVRFSVWVNVRALPHGCDPSYLSGYLSSENTTELSC